MKKSVLILLIFISWLFASAFSATGWKDSLYQQIKQEAEKSFSQLFQKKVSIGAAGGRVIGQIVLKDFSVPDLGRAPKVTLSFNPLKYAYTKGDIISSLSQITIEEFHKKND